MPKKIDKIGCLRFARIGRYMHSMHWEGSISLYGSGASKKSSLKNLLLETVETIEMLNKTLPKIKRMIKNV